MLNSTQASGKVEKIIRTIRESMSKSNKKRFIDKLAEFIEKYNTSNYIRIGCTPLKAVNDKSGKLIIENSFDGKYAKDFKKQFRKKFEKNGWVRMAKNEKLIGCSRYTKGKF